MTDRLDLLNSDLSDPATQDAFEPPIITHAQEDFTEEESDTDEILKYSKNYTHRQKVEFLKLYEDIQTYEQHDPTYRFRLVNRHQVDFLRALARTPKYKFIYLSTGNQGGKTAVLIYGMYLVARGMLKEYPHKPEPGKPLYLLLGGATDKIIKHSLLPELKKWARPGEIEEKKGSSGSIDHILVHNGLGLPDTVIVCMSYKAGATSFVGFKFHGVFCDEPFQDDVLEELLPRTIAYQCAVCIAATKTPAHAGPRFKWLKLLYKGQGSYKKYHDQKKVRILTASSYDNKVLKKEAIDDALGLHDPNSATYKMRVKGIPDDPEGCVYDMFKPIIYEDDKTVSWQVGGYNDVALDIPDLTDIKTYDVYGALDYGDQAPYAVLCILVSRITGTVWVVDECYRARLKPYMQMKFMKQMFKDWGVIPSVVVCDDQIDNELGAVTIYTQYMEALEKLQEEDRDTWDTYLFCDRSTKTNKAHGIATLGNKLAEINPKTGKPMLRILSKCTSLIEELESLLWKSTNSASRELTQGDDHAESALRYWGCSIYGFESE